MLILQNLTVQYGKRCILQDVNLAFEKGKVYVISGESGSGKSSLLNMLGLIQPPNKNCTLQ